MLQKVFAKTGESDLIFSVVPNSYRSLVGANTPRGSDITGKPFLWIVSPSVCFTTTNITEISSINNTCTVAGRRFGLLRRVPQAIRIAG